MRTTTTTTILKKKTPSSCPACLETRATRSSARARAPWPRSEPATGGERHRDGKIDLVASSRTRHRRGFRTARERFTGAENSNEARADKRIFEGQGGFKNTVESIEVVPVWIARRRSFGLGRSTGLNLGEGGDDVGREFNHREDFIAGRSARSLVGESIELRKALAVPDNVGCLGW